jgi:hypothetical protein
MKKLSDIEFINVIIIMMTMPHIDPVFVGFLAEYVREHTLTIVQRNKLADYIEGKLKRKNGRPSNKLDGYHYDDNELRLGDGPLHMQLAALDVKALKLEWREAGRRYRIHEPALKQVADEYGITPDKLENFIRRGKHPRKTR